MRTGAAARPIGFLIAILGAWGGILPYVGQRFGYRFDQTVGWHWTESHATLSLAAGVAAVVAGLLVFAAPLGAQRLGAVLALVAGTWFVVGPTLQPLWGGTAATPIATGTIGSNTMRALEAVGYRYGTGLVIVALGALALGLLALVVAPRATPASAPTPTAPPAARREPTPSREEPTLVR